MNKIGAERLKQTYSIVAGIPKELIRLESWVSNPGHPTTHCGTVACAIGWVMRHPDIAAQGLQRGRGGAHPVFRDSCYGWRAVRQFYKISEKQAFDLFGSERSRLDPADSAFLRYQPKAAVLRRIRLFLFRAGEITQARSEELEAYEATLQ